MDKQKTKFNFKVGDTYVYVLVETKIIHFLRRFF